VAYTRIKICGITSLTDAQAAVAAGADALGFVFYPPSPRAVSPAQAREIVRELGPLVTLVGLFVDASPAEVQSVLAEVPLHLLQFHGEESPSYCESFGRPYMKALRMRPDLDLDASFALYQSASAILLDAYRPGVPGGTGETFDWQRVPRNPSRPLVLAGGLTPENVTAALQATGVDSLDVSGGVECAPGRKDPIKIQTFIHNARHGL
jgi:phosphoribosylanthranilate isomerase